MEGKYTKGEWFVKHGHVYCETGIVALGGTIRKVDESRNEGESWLSMYERNKSVREELKQEREANSKLIAAAPELLDALQELIDPLTGLVYDRVAFILDNESCLKIESAINKALK